MGAPPRSTKVQAQQHEAFEAIYPGASQKLAFTGTTGQSAALGALTTLVRLFCDQDCFVLIGSNPTALNDGTSMFIASGIYEYVGVQPGQKIAAISNGTSGNLYITEAG